jgi:hypothetical protein
VAKLIKILAASVGGGIVLGAGIRLWEAMATWEPGLRPGQKFSVRLGALEDRLQSLEVETSQTAGTGLEYQAEKIVRAGSVGTAPDLRGELQEWLTENVAARMTEVEARLNAESERGQKQMLDAFVDSVQTRVIHRISQLEEEVAGQSAAMNELRECSLRTERSIQKLLGGLDKLIVKPPPAQNTEAEASTNQTPVDAAKAGQQAKAGSPPISPAPSAEEPPPSRPRPRWHIFG